MPNPNEYLAKKSLLDTKQDKLTAGDNITINPSTNVISATDTTYSDVIGATSSTAGTHGLVPAPAAGDESKFLKGDGTWGTVSAGSASLAGLTDVDLNNPADGQALVYDATNQEWVNGEAGNADYIELTQAEYDALTEEEKMNGTLYFITDGEGGGGSGSGGYSEIELWSGSQSTSAWASPIELPIRLDGYDLIIIQIGESQHVISVRQIPQSSTSNFISISGYLDDSSENLRSIFINKSDNTLYIYTTTSKAITVTKVVGIKVGGGIGGLDWNNKVTVTTTVIPPRGSITYTPTNPGVLIVSGYGTTDTLNVVISSSSMEDFYAPLIHQSWASSQIIVNANEELTIANGSSGVTMGGLMVYFVPFLNGGSSSSLSIDYSTDEQKTGRKWIDGKDIYERTYTSSLVVPWGGTWYNTGIPLTDVENLIDTQCRQSIAVWNVISGLNNAGTLNLVNQSSGNLTVENITIQYTKITD